jgi:serine/threonine protein kinase
VVRVQGRSEHDNSASGRVARRIRGMTDSSVVNNSGAELEATLGSPALGSPSKYHVLMELGRGGAAVVHAAIARGPAGFRKIVVLKTTRQELAESPEASEMFLKEARLSARMNHPNVVQIYEVYEDRGLPVLVMEYLDGQSLAGFLARYFADPAYDVRAPLSILCDALEGLHHAHSLSDFRGQPLDIVHRDVTPHNVMVTYDGQVKLLDFGIAKLNQIGGETRTGLIKGKLGYMPREQLDGSAIDRRADIFAMGVMIWECVARQRMWAGQTEAAILKHILCDEIPSLGQAVPNVDAELASICQRCLAPDREQRYSNAHELCLALRGYLQTRGGPVPHAALGGLVSAACAELKQKSQARLERELVRFSQSQDLSWNETTLNTLTLRPSSEQAARTSGRWPRERDTGTSAAYTGQAHAVSLPPRPRGALWISASVLGLALAGFCWPALTLHWEGVRATQPVAQAVAMPAAPSVVRAEFWAQPSSASVFLDGVLLSAGPFSGSLTRDGRAHELRFEAPGFLTLVRPVKLESDLEVAVALEPLAVELAPAPITAPVPQAAEGIKQPLLTAGGQQGKAAPQDKAAPQGKAAPRSKPATAYGKRAGTQAVRARVATPKLVPPLCSPPYQIDEGGIKRYRRECL